MDGDRVIYGAENGLSRRAALAVPAVIGSTFALAVQPVQAQTMIVAPTDGLTAGAVKVKTKDDEAAMKSQIDVYPDTPHAFNADYRPSYRKEPAEDGWKKALAWFKANGVS
jgi:dienelactone hydrolase